MAKEFKVLERNTYSMGALVASGALTTYAQIAQVQKMVYDFDVQITCFADRATMCDVLASLNNKIQQGELTKRTLKKGREIGRTSCRERGEA